MCDTIKIFEGLSLSVSWMEKGCVLIDIVESCETQDDTAVAGGEEKYNR